MDALFRFPSATEHVPAIDAWLESRDPALGPLARRWYARLRASGPGIRELMHDGCPVACVGDVAFAYVNVFKAHVNVGFFLGAMLDDPEGLLEGEGKRMRHVKLKPGSRGDGPALQRLIEDACSQAASLAHPASDGT
ncbi:MAG: hypothetical protein RLZZ200_428 [Pseudomonadota bacterium]